MTNAQAVALVAFTLELVGAFLFLAGILIQAVGDSLK